MTGTPRGFLFFLGVLNARSVLDAALSPDVTNSPF
jgi:hypothetical protein